MQKINFQNLPNTTTPINATNLNAIQTNVEDVFNGNVAMGNINAASVTTTGNVKIPKDSTHGIVNSNNDLLMKSNANGNVVINAANGDLYLGNTNTNNVSFFENNQIKFTKDGNVGDIFISGFKNAKVVASDTLINGQSKTYTFNNTNSIFLIITHANGNNSGGIELVYYNGGYHTTIKAPSYVTFAYSSGSVTATSQYTNRIVILEL